MLAKAAEAQIFVLDEKLKLYFVERLMNVEEAKTKTSSIIEGKINVNVARNSGLLKCK